MNNKCKQCERPLQNGEKDLCPACESNDDFEWKKWVSIGAATAGVIGAIFSGLAQAAKK